MIIRHPYVTEKATSLSEERNAIQFIVDIRATKVEIKREIEQLYGVKVAGVTTLIAPNGKKKATVKLGPADSAEELASRLGVF
jgi:large subunit ribosomal protein L23